MEHDPNCDICKNNLEFEIPEDLYEALKKGKLIVFAGSGVSTEAKGIFPYTFYDDVCDDLDIDPKSCRLSFSELMSELTKQPNGRRKLLVKIKERIDYVKSFTQLYTMTTRFHNELSTMHQIDNIVTTNWDDFFELECAALPVVTADDFAFWDLPGRKVYKIHGSINNVGTIISDTEDYARCHDNLVRGVIGSALKMMLATKTVVFCGYSLKDEDFLSIYDSVLTELYPVLPHAYMVTLDESVTTRIDTKKITPIITDGTFFMHKLKMKLMEDGLLLDDIVYGEAYLQIEKLHEMHKTKLSAFDLLENVDVAYTYSYQDGLSDSLNRAIRLNATGEYLCPTYLRRHIAGYEDLRKSKVKERRYWDIAYIDGYLNGLFFFLVDEEHRRKVPMYYIYGSKKDIFDFDEYKTIIDNGKTYHKQAHAWAVRNIGKSPAFPEGIVPQHTAFLL